MAPPQADLGKIGKDGFGIVEEYLARRRASCWKETYPKKEAALDSTQAARELGGMVFGKIGKDAFGILDEYLAGGRASRRKETYPKNEAALHSTQAAGVVGGMVFVRYGGGRSKLRGAKNLW